MDRGRCDAWAAAFAKLKAGFKVWDLPSEEHSALLRPGLFEGMDDVTAQEEADLVVHYWLRGRDLSPIAPRGPAIAKNWHNIGPTFGEDRADEALRNYIEASTNDPDYWDALRLIAVWFHKKDRPFPKRLAGWAIQRYEYPTASPRHIGDKGRPYYAKASRNFAIADVFDLLGSLGMGRKSLRYSVIAEFLSCSEDTVRKAIANHAKNHGEFPAPWECWPPPRRRR